MSDSPAKKPLNKVPLLNAFLFFGLLCVLGGFAWSVASGGVFSVILSQSIPSEEKIAFIKEYFDRFGAFAPLAYVALVSVEVIVAPIPGLMLYAPGGLIFGGFLGGLYAIIGNALGAGIACAVAHRVFNIDQVKDHPKLHHICETIKEHGGAVIFLLRLNPVTSSDLVSYAAGLINIPATRVMLATALGMAPQCWVQAYLAENIFAWAPWLINALVIVCAIYFVAAAWVVIRLSRKPKPPAA
jgi:uncharacterized membrane protein YdjX (TVP38/TMEM64 family)